MVTKNIKEGYVDYMVKILAGKVNGERKVWAEMWTPEYGLMKSAYINAPEDNDITHQLGETLVDDLIDEYEEKLKTKS